VNGKELEGSLVFVDAFLIDFFALWKREHGIPLLIPLAC
jgi:hypothetical protein